MVKGYQPRKHSKIFRSEILAQKVNTHDLRVTLAPTCTLIFKFMYSSALIIWTSFIRSTISYLDLLGTSNTLVRMRRGRG